MATVSLTKEYPAYRALMTVYGNISRANHAITDDDIAEIQTHLATMKKDGINPDELQAHMTSHAEQHGVRLNAYMALQAGISQMKGAAADEAAAKAESPEQPAAELTPEQQAAAAEKATFSNMTINDYLNYAKAHPQEFADASGQRATGVLQQMLNTNTLNGDMKLSTNVVGDILKAYGVTADQKSGYRDEAARLTDNPVQPDSVVASQAKAQLAAKATAAGASLDAVGSYVRGADGKTGEFISAKDGRDTAALTQAMDFLKVWHESVGQPLPDTADDAIKNFQKANGLREDAVIGRETLGAMQTAHGVLVGDAFGTQKLAQEQIDGTKIATGVMTDHVYRGGTIDGNTTGDAVKQAENLLGSIYKGQSFKDQDGKPITVTVTADGKLDAGEQALITHFQQGTGLAASGVIDKSTMFAMLDVNAQKQVAEIKAATNTTGGETVAEDEPKDSKSVANVPPPSTTVMGRN